MMKEINFEIKIPIFKISPERKVQLRMFFSILALVGVFFTDNKFEFTQMEFLILAYFILSLIWSISSRWTAALALLFLVGCPILISLEKENLAEISAVYAYYFLVIVVINEIISMFLEKKNKNKFRKL